MKIIAIISQKGGAGKTTLALHLAVASELAGRPTAVVDLDPQASASGWGDHRAREQPAVVSCQATRLPQVLEAARQGGAALAIIDTAPHSETSALAAARAADLILIPCRPAILDLRAIGVTIDLVKLAGKPAAVVLNAVPPRGGLGEDALDAISIYDVEVCPVKLCQRSGFVHALTNGLTTQEHDPDGKAATEVRRFYRWTCRRVGL